MIYGILGSFVDAYWDIISSTAKRILPILAVIVPLEVLWPIRPLPLKKRIFHLCFAMLTTPLCLTLAKLGVAWVSGVGITSGAWVKLASLRTQVPTWTFVPPLNLAPLFRVLPFPAFWFVMLALFVGDFFFYWWHRSVHTIPVLWPIHKLHHLDENVNTLTSELTHVFDGPITILVLNFGAIYLLRCVGGIEPEPGQTAFEAVMLFILGNKIQLWATHGNMKFRYGLLTRVIVGPQVHRIHHSSLGHHVNKNFATMFPIWDIIFGTYCHPSRDEWPESGVAGESQPRSQWEAVLVPIKAWGAMIASVRHKLATNRKFTAMPVDRCPDQVESSAQNQENRIRRS